MEKLSYSRTECNSYLYFSFNAVFFDPDTVTKQLGIEPTSIMVKDSPIPKSTSWKYQINVGKEVDLETPLEKVITLFENKFEVINQLKKELKLTTRLQFVIEIAIDLETSTPYFGLNKRAIDFLSKTKTEVDFDLYKVDTIGLFDDQ